jgi:hypothetical protein
MVGRPVLSCQAFPIFPRFPAGEEDQNPNAVCKIGEGSSEPLMSEMVAGRACWFNKFCDVASAVPSRNSPSLISLARISWKSRTLQIKSDFCELGEGGLEVFDPSDL